MPMAQKPRTVCLNCGKKAERWNHKFCSNRCQNDHQYKQFIEEWKEGKRDGGSAVGLISNHIRRYLVEKYGEQCSECGWNKRHLITRVVPLAVHHIDGDWTNNREENLILLCPNCHALTENFQNLNRGKGRTNRRKYEGREQ